MLQQALSGDAHTLPQPADDQRAYIHPAQKGNPNTSKPQNLIASNPNPNSHSKSKPACHSSHTMPLSSPFKISPCQSQASAQSTCPTASAQPDARPSRAPTPPGDLAGLHVLGHRAGVRLMQTRSDWASLCASTGRDFQSVLSKLGGGDRVPTHFPTVTTADVTCSSPNHAQQAED